MINHLQQAIFFLKFPFCSVPQKPYCAQTLICKAHDSNTLLTSKLWPQPPKVLLKRRHRHTLHTCKATTPPEKKKHNNNNNKIQNRKQEENWWEILGQGVGTGTAWCRGILLKIFQLLENPFGSHDDEMSPY